MRYPVMTQCLRLARTIAPQAMETIIDIGVQVKTDFLMEVFPDRHQHLFEPATIYHSKLEDNYRSKGIDYTLHKVAVGDADEILYLHKTSVDGSGRITHSQLRSERDEQMPFLVEIEKIPSRRLDTIFPTGALLDLSYVVKMDVDGIEEKIISG
jgi:FkbM family methyltransferase